MKDFKYLLFNWGIKLIGVVLLIILLCKVDLPAVLQALKRFHWQDIVVLEILSAIVILTKAWRFKILAGRYSIPIDLKGSIVIYGSSMFFSAITPGRVGDFIKVFYLKNLYESSLRKGIYLNVVDRIFDLLTIGIFALIGLSLFVSVKSIAIGCLIFMLFIMSFVIFGKKYINNSVAKFTGWIGRRFNANLQNFDFSQLFSRQLILPGIFSLIPNGFIFLQMILIANILGVIFRPLELIGILALGNLLSMLPITISGLGTRDATFVYLLAKKDINSATALSLSLAFFLFNNLGILFFGMILFLIFKPQIHEPELNR